MADADKKPLPFSSHLDELRRRLIWIVAGVVVAFSVVFALWAKDIVMYLQEIAVVERELPAVADTLAERDNPLIEVRGNAAPAEGKFLADISLDVVDRDSVLAAVPSSRAGGVVLRGTLKPGTLVQTGEDGLPWLELVADGREYAVSISGDTAMALHPGGVKLAAAPGVVEPHKIRFSVIGTLENFGTTMRVSFYAALAFAYPWAMLQIYLFVAPGLYRRERRFFKVAIPSVFVLFFAGAAFGRYVLLPISIGFLLDFNVKEFDVQTNYSLGQYLNLVFTLTFGLGFVFQLPLVVAPLVRFGLLSPEFFKRNRKWTLFGSVVLGAVISPTGLVFDMFLAGAPIFLLIEGGVMIGRLWKRMALKQAAKEALRRAEAGEKFDPEELAGGLALDLEKKLAEFASGGARKFARELMQGLREGRESAEESRSLFDDEYSDDDKPPAEVKLKPRPPAQETAKPEPAPQPAALPDQVFTPATAVAAEPPAAKPEEWPDRPWVEGVDENLAQYIEDRVSQRLQQYMDRELRPWMERVERELRQRD